MATTLQLRSNIKKLKKALEAKGISPAIKTKLKAQLDKAESELASSKKSGKAPKASVVKSGASSLSKLQKLIQKKKYSVYQGQGVDLERDSNKPAKPIGKRTSKSGKRYYEYRANRIDVKQPPKTYPKLEEGGYMADGGEIKTGDIVELQDGLKGTIIELKNKWVRVKTLEKYGGDVVTVYKKDVIKMASGGYMADGGVIYLESVGTYFRPSDMTVSPMEDFNNEGEITHISDVDEEWISKLSPEDNKIIFNNMLSSHFKKTKEKGGYMADGGETHRFEKGGNLKSIKDKYEENEDNNAHSENVVLLAKHFGTKEDLAEAKEILALHEKEGHLSSENGKKRQELHLKLIDKARKEMGEKGIEFKKGGRILFNGRGESEKEVWGKHDLYKMYENNIELIADIYDYVEMLKDDISKDYADEFKKDLIQALEKGKIVFNDKSFLRL